MGMKQKKCVQKQLTAALNTIDEILKENLNLKNQISLLITEKNLDKTKHPQQLRL